MHDMAASKAPPPVNQETGGSVDDASPFDPSVWEDFFVTYTPPELERSEDWMRKRGDQLKAEVRRMFETCKSMSAADMITLVDALERLGIDNHFHEEIDTALGHAYNDGLEFGSYSNDLHIIALWFRILRQHGFWVSADVFDKFKDDTGHFKATLSSDPRSLLSLYNAAHLATLGVSDEQALDEAIYFSRRHLESMKGKLKSPMAEQVSRALDIPLPRAPKRLETMCYITEYEEEEAHDDVLLELARLDFDLIRSLHIKELKTLSLWWRDLYDDVKLSYARDRLIENYFWTCGILHEEEYSRARMLFSKTMGLFSLMDDTYDVHATLEECHKLSEAIQRWDESMVSILPEYLRKLYIKFVKTFNEIEDMLEPCEKYRMAYIKKMFKLLSRSYLKQAEWFSKNYSPSFKEHTDVSVMSTGLPTLFLVALMGLGQRVTKEAFDWALKIPDMMLGCAETGRFLNDITSYKRGKSKMDPASSLECYIKEHGVTVEDAMAAFATMTEHAWRRINLACMESDRGILPTAQLVVDMNRMNETWHIRGGDMYTYGSSIKESVASLFLKDFPV